MCTYTDITFSFLFLFLPEEPEGENNGGSAVRRPTDVVAPV